MSVQTLMPQTDPTVPPPLPSAPPPSERRVFNKDTLLGRFQIMAAVTTVLAVLALVACIIVLNLIAANFREVATKITPSIAAAQTLGQAIEEMDAFAADYQLTSRIDVTSPDLNATVYGDAGFRNTAWQELQKRLRDFDNALITARTKANYEGEADAINRIANRFYDYTAQINLMRYELDKGRKEAALANYKAAQDILVGNLGNAERDAQGNSREKLLKDRNWETGDFTCAVNCAAGSQNTKSNIAFDVKANYEGISANIHKLAEINQARLSKLGSSNFLEAIIVTVASVVLAVMTIVIAVYYAITTHRIINFGYLLAVIAALAFAWLLIINLNSNINDYKQFSEQYVPAIRAASAVRQLSAGANADISRLLLSPDSPGLDSTSSDLTTDVKQAFKDTNLLASYQVKKTQVQKELDNLWKLTDTDAERIELCKVANSPAKNCPTGSPFYWTTGYANAVTNILDRFNRKLLADAIAINISPKAAQGQLSAREPYNQFTVAIDNFANINKSAFDTRECSAIGQSEFSQTACTNLGYINWLQILIWIAYPLIVLLVAAGVAFSSREF